MNQRVVVNTLPLLSPLTGVGNYAYQIVRRMAGHEEWPDLFFFNGHMCTRKLAVYDEASEGVVSTNKLKELAGRVPLLMPVLSRLYLGLARLQFREYGLYFEPNFIPVEIKARRTVVTVHDFSFDLQPEWHPKERVDFFKRNFWSRIKRADKVIFVSDFIRKSAVEQYGFEPDRLEVIHNGYDSDVFRRFGRDELEPVRQRYSLPENFILFVGSIEPRKNLKSLIQAYSRLPERLRKEAKLVLAGFKGWKNEEVMELLRKLDGDVCYLGYIPEEDLGKIYSLASLFVYPSFYEGFGLPPLEAMASGCPVVTSDVASMPEVCGDAVYYADPHEVGSIADAMEKVLDDKALARSLVDKGLERCTRFSWQASADRHMELFSALCG